MQTPLLAKREDVEAQREKEAQKTEKAVPVNTAFWTKFNLALSIAFWVTLFFVPVVSPTWHEWFFVDLDVANTLASSDFESYWPNTVQLIVFTVYFSTGSTIQLAWQGLAGTLVAGVNQWFMGKLFPFGGKCKDGAWVESTTHGLRGYCSEYQDPNYEKYLWFVWLDVFAYIFLVLSANSKENTMKFGLSWHMFYMMAFMAPSGYQPSHAVNITTVIGVSLAILVTLVPQRSTGGGLTCNMVQGNRLDDLPTANAAKVKEVTVTSIDFMLGDKPVGTDDFNRFKLQKFSVCQKIDQLPGLSADMKSCYDQSWWEGWLYILTGDLAWFRQVRTHCGLMASAFTDDIGGFDDVANVLKKSVTSADVTLFKMMDPREIELVERERRGLKPALHALNASSMDLLSTMSTWKGDFSDTFERTLNEMKGKVELQFREFATAFTAWKADNPVDKSSSSGRKALRSNLNLFVFSIMQLSKETMDLSDKVVEEYKRTIKSADQKREKSRGDHGVDLLKSIMSEFVATFMTSTTYENDAGDILTKQRPFLLHLFSKQGGEKRSFVIRNFLSIGICFVLGNVLHGNVFASPYNPFLAGTLAVLISHFPGSAYYKNLLRLLGLAVGNALPIIMLAVVSIFAVWPLLHPIVHLAAFFMFEFYFCLMYYTSIEWTYVGCIVAGFGCYSFVGLTESWSAAGFSAAYCKIGQATAAIVIQIIVDGIDTKFRKKFPRDIVVANMQTLLIGPSGLVEVFKKLTLCLSTDGTDASQFKKVKNMIKTNKAIMAEQEQMVKECDAKTTIIGGPEPAFNLTLYTKSLEQIKEILDQVDALCLVEEFTEFISEKIGNREPWFEDTADFKRYTEKVHESLEAAHRTLMRAFATTETLKNPELCKETDEDLTPKFTENLAMSVVKRTMMDALTHAQMIEAECCAMGAVEVSAP